MSRRRRVAARLSAYGDVRTMLSAMKSIALMELFKLGGQIERQQAVMETVERTAAEFLAAHDVPLQTGRTACIVIGSERGFCGEFNDELLPGVAAARARGDALLLVGNRLAGRFAGQDGDGDVLPGPNIAEEIPLVLEGVTRWLERVQAAAPEFPLHVMVLCHHDGKPAERTIAPLPDTPGRQVAAGYPPCLTMAPADLLGKLLEQAILLALQGVFALSLVAENQRRLAHMENALRRLEEITTTLEQDLNRARQEDIIQEIETILIGYPALETATSKSS